MSRYVDHHRRELEVATGRSIDPNEWYRGYELCVYDLTINRISQYAMAHTFRHYAFMGRVFGTVRRLVELAKGRES